MSLRVVVTGSVGFIGSHLVNYLNERGYWVRGVDVRPKSQCFLETEEDEFLQLDLREYDNCVKAVEDVDWVFNLAADMGGIGYIKTVFSPVMRNNVLINCNMLEASRFEGVKRFFFSSSACIYPEYLQDKTSSEYEMQQRVFILREKDAFPAQPDSYYGWEKLFTEILCEAYKRDYGLEPRIARYHNIYGSHTTYEGGKEKAPAALCRKIAELPSEGGEIDVWGDGKQVRSFLYIDNCLEATHRLMLSDYSKPLNIGSDEHVTINRLIDMIAEVAGKKVHKKYDLSKPQGVRSRSADLTLVKETLSWEPATSLKTGIGKLYRWIHKQVI